MSLFPDFLPKFSVLFSDFILSAEVNNLLLLTAALFLFITTIAILMNQKLIYNIILLSVFSLLISLIYLLMDAPDVAMTEVALGSCLSTCVLLNMAKILEKRCDQSLQTESVNSLDSSLYANNTQLQDKIVTKEFNRLGLEKSNDIRHKKTNIKHIANKFFAISLCVTLVITLIMIMDDLPKYGDHSSIAQNHISKYYLENTPNDIGIPSVVAAILASYRGYDTLGETTVILIAAVAVLTILSTTRKIL